VLLFVNVSPATLEHPEFDPRRLVYGITRRGFDPTRVVLEVTERAISDIERVVERAQAFRELGVKLALDDAGAGNAGLWMLSILPVDYIKIDGAIVNRALADKTCRAVLAGIAAIAQETDSILVAEGIETAEALEFIKGMGKVRAVQGFLIARPAIAATADFNETALRNRLSSSRLTA
jgi:EAL domain-containing protein (putative c-di-GMP-specific phosphodiesterase class I)